MKARLCFVLLLVAIIGGCGGPNDQGGRVAADPAVTRRSTAPPERTVSKHSADLPPGPATSEPVSEPPGIEESSARNWTNPAGDVLAVAELIEVMDGKVCLQKTGGEGIVIPIEELSQADQAYVRSQLSAAAPQPAEEEPKPAAGTPSEGGSYGEHTPSASDTLPRPVAHQDRVVIPFDFVSKFDQGRYGQMVGDMIWKKLDREGGFIIPETMLDVRDTCTSRNLQPSPEMGLEEMKKIVRQDFGAHIGIWGSVERVPGHEWDVYDLVIKCVDFTGHPQPKVIYQQRARTKVVSEIPHLYVNEMLDALYDRQPGGPPPVDELAEKNWLENPSLVTGDFQQGSGGVPSGWADHWEAGDVNQREPLGRTIRWIPEAGNPTNRVIRFTFDAGVGDSTGVAYYGKFFPVEEGAKYRFQCRWRSNGPEAKVFIKCYDQVGTQYQRESEYRPALSGGGGRAYVPEISQMREVYRSQQNLKGPKNTWNTQTEDFTPKHTKYTPRWGRVMLYAYLGAGTVEFDDVVVKQIIPASPSDAAKDRRHSLETKVTVKEMEENQRRSREAKEKSQRDKTRKE